MSRREGPVLFVIGSARPGGAEGQMVRLACELRARDVDVRMLFLVYGGVLTSHLDEAKVPWSVMRRDDWPPSSTARNIFGLLRLAWTIARARPAVVCAWLAGAAWPALIAAQLLTRARRVVGFRGEVFDRDLRWQAPLFRFVVRRADAVTVNSPTLKDEAIRWSARPERIQMIPNGVDLPAALSDVSRERATAVVVANFRYYKGYDVLAEALNLRPRSADAAVIRLCGEGDERAPTSAALAGEQYAGRVVFVDIPADVPAELRAAQFAIHPSRTEGMSNAILEQLAHGLPVVATDVGATSLLVRDGVSGVLIPAGDAERLRDSIELMESDVALRERLGRGARAVAEEFAWDRCATNYLKVFALDVEAACAR